MVILTYAEDEGSRDVTKGFLCDREQLWEEEQPRLSPSNVVDEKHTSNIEEYSERTRLLAEGSEVVDKHTTVESVQDQSSNILAIKPTPYEESELFGQQRSSGLDIEIVISTDSAQKTRHIIQEVEVVDNSGEDPISVDPLCNSSEPTSELERKGGSTKLSLTEPCDTNLKHTANVPVNLFSKLYIFFHSDVDCAIIPHILEDLIRRRFYSLEEILDHLQKFWETILLEDKSAKSSRTKDQILTARLFTFLIGKAFDEHLLDHVEPHHIEKLANILLNQPDCFEELLRDQCRNADKSGLLSTKHIPNRLKLTELCFSKINKGESMLVKSLDQRLACGETPVNLAARFRCSKMLLMLLQHGASVLTRWLCFSNVYDVLLFSPHQVSVSDHDKQMIVDCMEILLRATTQVKLTAIRRKGPDLVVDLVPLVGDWRGLIPDDRLLSPCPLMQQCRVKVRKILHEHRRLPNGISRLPLPTLLKEYINLKS